jgi:hypothetical protein
MICQKAERNKKYISPEHSDFVCSACTQILIQTPNDELKAAAKKAEENGNTRKAAGIRIFTGAKPNAEKTPDSKKHILRRRITKMVRSKQKQAGRTSEKRTLSLC